MFKNGDKVEYNNGFKGSNKTGTFVGNDTMTNEFYVVCEDSGELKCWAKQFTKPYVEKIKVFTLYSHKLDTVLDYQFYKVGDRDVQVGDVVKWGKKLSGGYYTVYEIKEVDSNVQYIFEPHKDMSTYRKV